MQRGRLNCIKNIGGIFPCLTLSQAIKKKGRRNKIWRRKKIRRYLNKLFYFTILYKKSCDRIIIILYFELILSFTQ